MNNDELLTRSLLGAMGGIVAWLAWVFTGVVSAPSDSTVVTIALSVGATIVVFLLCRALQRAAGVSDPERLARAMACFVGFGALGLALFLNDGPEMVVRMLSTASPMGCGLFLAFGPRPAVGGAGLAVALSAIDTPFYGTVLLAVGLAAYLAKNPLAFRR